MRTISKRALTLLLCAGFCGSALIFSAPANAKPEVNLNVDLGFWGTTDEYHSWCRDNYPSCVTWSELPREYRYRYRDWWEGRHHGEHWGIKVEHHEREHEHEHEHED